MDRVLLKWECGLQSDLLSSWGCQNCCGCVIGRGGGSRYMPFTAEHRLVLPQLGAAEFLSLQCPVEKPCSAEPHAHLYSPEFHHGKTPKRIWSQDTHFSVVKLIYSKHAVTSSQKEKNSKSGIGQWYLLSSLLFSLVLNVWTSAAEGKEVKGLHVRREDNQSFLISRHYT